MKAFSIFSVLSLLFFFSCGGGGGGGGNIHSLNELLPVQKETCYVTTPLPNRELISLLATSTGMGYGSLSWNIKWLSPEGKIESKRLDFTDSIQTIPIEFVRNRATPVLAFLEVNGRQDILPAGSIYPVNISGNSISLSWLNGISAQVLMDLLTKTNQPAEEAQRFCNYFNWKKFQTEFAKRVDEPWLIDKEKITEKLCTGSFSVSVFKEAKTYECVIQHDSLGWICPPYGDGQPVRTGDTAFFPLGKTLYLSGQGPVFIEKESARNALVITELAR